MEPKEPKRRRKWKGQTARMKWWALHVDTAVRRPMEGEPAELATLGCLLDQENEQENTRNKTRVEGGRFIENVWWCWWGDKWWRRSGQDR
jgi:hypothetical protein